MANEDSIEGSLEIKEKNGKCVVNFEAEDFGEFESRELAELFGNILLVQRFPESSVNIGDDWRKPFQQWLYNQVSEFLGLSDTLKLIAPTFNKHYIDGPAFVELTLKDMEAMGGFQDPQVRQVFMNLLSFFRRLEQRPFPNYYSNINLNSSTMARFKNAPEPDIEVNLKGDPLPKFVIKSDEEFQKHLMKYIDEIKDGAENFIFCYKSDMCLNLIQKFSDKNPNQFDKMCIDFEEDAGNREITDVKQRYQIQLGFVVTVLKELLASKSLDEIVKLSAKQKHDSLYSQHIVHEPRTHRKYFNYRHFYNFLQLLPLNGKLTVEVCHACNMFRSHEISLKLPIYRQIHRRAGHSLFMDQKSRKQNGLELVNDYHKYVEVLLGPAEGVSVDSNPEVTFFYTSFFQFWDTSFSELGTVVIYNQISGFSMIHEIPPLIGIYLQGCRRKPVEEIVKILEELKAKNIGKTTVLYPGDFLICSPFHYRAIWTPHEKFHPELIKDVSLLRGCYVNIESLTEKYVNDLRDEDWFQISDAIGFDDEEDDSDNDIITLKRSIMISTDD